MFDLTGRLVVITGATGGLGKEMTFAFLKEGAEVLITDLVDSDLKRFVYQTKGFGSGKVLGSIAVDLTTREGVEDLTKFILGYCEYGPDVLVNNAGIAVFGPYYEIPVSKLESILELNLLTPMRLIRKLLPYMLKRASGHIVNISSVAGIIATAGLTAYSTSKFGLRAFGEALSKEVRPLGIGVTNVYPFFTRTPILNSEQIGLSQKKIIPDFLLSEPKDVVNDMINGIKSNQLHVYPGPISQVFSWISRLTPGLLEELAEKFYRG